MEENSQGFTVSTSKPYAKVTIRYAASFLDGIIIAILIFLPLGLLFSSLGININGNSSGSVVLNLLVVLITVSYTILFTKKYGGTLGKLFFKTKVVSDNGQPLTLGKVVIRETIGKFASAFIFMLGYIWAIFDKRKQSWHDKIAGTIVVQNETLSKGRKIFAYIIAFLIPLALLGILAVAVLSTVNPERQLERTRETQERILQEGKRRQKLIDEIESITGAPSYTY